jgi:hypothetical protein
VENTGLLAFKTHNVYTKAVAYCTSSLEEISVGYLGSEGRIILKVI